MSKLILIILFPVITFSQEVSLRIDWQNLIWGSDVNKPALNFKIGIRDDFIFEGVKFGMEYEAFNEISYQQWTFAKFDYEIVLGKFSLLPGFAFSQIYHETSYSRDAMSYTFNLELTYELNDYLRLSVQADREQASDISQQWRDSIYGGIIYKWN